MPETSPDQEHDAVSNRTPVASSTILIVVTVGILAALMATQAVTVWGSPATIPKDLADLPTTAPEEKFQEKELATRRMFAINASASIAILSACLGTVACAGATSGYGNRIASLLAGLLIGAAAGAIAGYLGELLLQQLRTIPEATLSSMLRVMIAQCALWIIAGTGMAIAIRLRRPVPLVHLMGAVIGAAVLGTVLSSVAGAIVFPLAETDHIVPAEGANRFLWAGVTAAVTIGLLVRGTHKAAATLISNDVPSSPNR